MLRRFNHGFSGRVPAVGVANWTESSSGQGDGLALVANLIGKRRRENTLDVSSADLKMDLLLGVSHDAFAQTHLEGVVRRQNSSTE